MRPSRSRMSCRLDVSASTAMISLRVPSIKWWPDYTLVLRVTARQIAKRGAGCTRSAGMCICVGTTTDPVLSLLARGLDGASWGGGNALSCQQLYCLCW